MNLQPTFPELQDLFWRSIWTFISSALGVPVADSFLNWDIPILEQMLCAGIVGVVNVVLVYARQKAGTIHPQTQTPAAPR